MVFVEKIHVKINYLRSLSYSSGVGYEAVVGSSGDYDCNPDGVPTFS